MQTLERQVERVPPAGTGREKEQAVQRMFSSIARYYDLNNSLLSLGLHHYWKREAVKCLTAPLAGACGVRGGEVSAEPRYILDLGAGTADLEIGRASCR